MTEPQPPHRLRVAIVGDYPVGGDRVGGGVESAFLYLVEGLRRIEGLELHLVTLDRRASARRVIPATATGGPTIHVLPMFPRLELLRGFRTYRRWLREVLDGIRPDVVHAQGATDHAFAALRSGHPTVVTAHGIQREDARHQATLALRLRKRLYARLIERDNLRRTRHLIAIAGYVTEYFRDVLDPRTHVHQIPNAVADRYFELPAAPGDRVVLYAGRLIERKRVADLVSAFARIAGDVPGATLRLAGDERSEPAYTAEIRRRIESAGLADRVHLLGALSEDAIADEYARADAFALASIQETTPMVIGQAMAAGRPVIATAVGGVAEMVADGVSGRVLAPGDVEGFAAGLRDVLADPARARAWGEAGRRHAEADYRVDVVAARTAEVYRAVAAEGGAEGRATGGAERRARGAARRA